jgi:glycosyltransferase involved in cell wall biosynthesis
MIFSKIDTHKRKLKILLSAYSCEPGFSSERGVGWNWAVQISQIHEIWVLTRQTNKMNIEAELNHCEYHNLHFLYFDLPQWLRFWKKGERGLYLYYIMWQLCSLFVALKWHRQIKFDLTHYLTFGSILLPTFIFLMPTKLILGPIGGGGKAPLSFLREFSFKGRVNEITRHLVQGLYRLNPLLYLQTAKADSILVRDKETYMMIPRIFRWKAEIFLETGVPPELINVRISEEGKTQNDGLKIITVGRFIHSKISILTLKAIKRFREKYHLPFTFIIVGDGREKKNLLRYCQLNYMCGYISFTGWLPREKVFDLLLGSDIYLATSFKEGGSWALFEAIAAELPIVSLKTGGPDIMICDECGIKVEIKTPVSVIEELAEGLLKLAQNPALRKSLALRAKDYLMKNHSWKEIGEKVATLYAEVV